MYVETPDRAEFRPSRVKMFLGFLGSFGFVAIGLFLLLGDGTETTEKAVTNGFVILFFGGCGLVFAKGLFEREPRFVVGKAGVSVSGTTIGTVPWDAIARIVVQRAGRQKTFGLVLHEPERHLDTGNAWKKLIHSLPKGGCHLSLTAVGLKASHRDLEEALRRFSGQRFTASLGR